MLFDKILEQDQFLQMTLAMHNELLSKVFSDDKIAAFSNMHPELAKHQDLFVEGCRGLTVLVVRRFMDEID